MPQLSLFAAVRSGVEVGGPPASYQAAPLFPSSIAALAGFPADLELQAAPGAGGGWSGYTVGPTPAGMTLSTVGAGGGNKTDMAARWTPCPADGGTTAVCFAAAAYRPAGSAGAATVSSEMQCVAWTVAGDPAPVFLNSSARAANLTMGRAGSFSVFAADGNCQDAVSLAVLAPPSRNASGWAWGWGLPAGASLAPVAASASAAGPCGNGGGLTVTWTPGNTFGGFAQVGRAGSAGDPDAVARKSG